ncbi:MAG: tetratricopeptide repeat protein [Bdellovibrionales bacterium]|nr:tetratricopeptide repeat protein [Bdellovibrionales bacterium]
MAASPKAAGPATPPKEDLVAAAQKLALAGQRHKGQTKLVQAINNLSGESSEKTQLIGALNQISRAFFGERTQAVFELGESLFYSNKPAEAQPRYQEAADLEPENTRIGAALARNLLAQGNCDEARAIAAKGAQLNPFDQELKLFLLRSEICSGISEERREGWERDVAQLEAQFAFEAAWLKVLADDAAGNREATVSGARKISKSDPEFPEPLYLLWKHSPASPTKRSWAANYVSLCKKSDQARRRRYKNEPKLCSWQQQLEEAADKGTE